MQRSLSIPEAIDLAVQYQQSGRLEEARRIYLQVLQLHPQHPEALHLLGLIEHRVGRNREAIELISRAIALLPQAAHFHANLGTVLRDQKELDRAETALREAIRLEPANAPAHYNLALVLLDGGRAPEALAELRTAIQINPASLDARLTLATTLGRSGDYAGAYAAAAEALRIQPDNAPALTAAAAALERSGRPSQAAELLRTAVTIDPNFATAWTNLAIALDDLGFHQEAISAHRHAIRLAPDDPQPASLSLMTLLRSDGLAPAEIADEHRHWGNRFAATIATHAAPSPPRNSAPKIRVGYLSGDFNAHAVATFLLPLLAAHDRQRIEITCYATSDKRDDVTERFRALGDRWRNITSLADSSAADQIRADEIDILVDLSGHSEHNRLQLFAHKPAPVQVTYLGYPATTGVQAIDYRITDEICDPPGMTEPLHTERLFRVPAPFLCYAPPPHAPAVAPLPLDSNGHVTFVSSSTTAKITSSTIRAWATILRSVPQSRLLMKHLSLGEAQTRTLWLTRFAEHGVAADRIDFRAYLDHAEHLSTVTNCDIALDTFPYCGTTTTCEALWMGVPVISLVGNTHVSRVGLTLLNSVGLSALAAPSEDDYVTTAVALAGDTIRLRELRASLRETMSRSPLTDANRLARAIESAYQSIQQRQAR
ncbi:MAG: hypothetical protein QOF78_3697 [Phycisphaerales bacterium]|nr:hypothetical protein [Phycisphaerales bacterium]